MSTYILNYLSLFDYRRYFFIKNTSFLSTHPLDFIFSKVKQLPFTLELFFFSFIILED